MSESSTAVSVHKIYNNAVTENSKESETYNVYVPSHTPITPERATTLPHNPISPLYHVQTDSEPGNSPKIIWHPNSHSNRFHVRALPSSV